MHLANHDSMVLLAHFKGHMMGGFGGALNFDGVLKNISIGVASSESKLLFHSAGTNSSSWVSAAQSDFLESMAEGASAVCNGSRHGIHTLEHAEELGLGSRMYSLVQI